MTWKAVLAIVLAVGVLIGGILTVRSSARTGTPEGELLSRAKKRAEKNRAKEAGEDQWRR